MQQVLKRNKMELYSKEDQVQLVKKAIRAKNSYSNLFARHLFNNIKPFGHSINKREYRLCSKEKLPFFYIKKKGNNRVVLLKYPRPLEGVIKEYDLTSVLITIESHKPFDVYLATKITDLLQRTRILEGEEEAKRLQYSMCSALPFSPFEEN